MGQTQHGSSLRSPYKEFYVISQMEQMKFLSFLGFLIFLRNYGKHDYQVSLGRLPQLKRHTVLKKHKRVFASTPTGPSLVCRF
jgi:hypothetical protein